MGSLVFWFTVCALPVIRTLETSPIWDVVTNCEIPNESEPGACEYPRHCRAFQKINDASSFSNISRLTFVTRLQCSDGKVCCPRRDSYINPWIDMSNVTKRNRMPLLVTKRGPVFPVQTPCGVDDFTGRVNQGQITTMYEFPWMAILLYERTMDPVKPGCGGAVISSSFVITAAHCLTGQILRQNGALKFVRLGEYNLIENPDCTIVDAAYQECTEKVTDLKPKRILAHPDYNADSKSKHHDIGLIELDQPVVFGDFIYHICLPDVHSVVVTEKFTVCGWGRTDFFRDGMQSGIHSPVKMKTSVPYVDHENCSASYQPQSIVLSNGQLCAGGRDARDSCSGDSGSPLMHYDRKKAVWVLTGIVSMGPQNCGTIGKPGIYTNVKEYVQWIKTNANM